MQELGLQNAYQRDEGSYKFIRKLLALPLIPAGEIVPQFEDLTKKATGPLVHLVEYISGQWIYNPMFPPQSWSVYKMPIRTNNDVEGWHNALNRRAGRDSLQFYVLIELLHNEAMLVSLQMRLVSDDKLSRIQKKNINNYRRNSMSNGSYMNKEARLWLSS